jgi:hypothetical protein
VIRIGSAFIARSADPQACAGTNAS